MGVLAESTAKFKILQFREIEEYELFVVDKGVLLNIDRFQVWTITDLDDLGASEQKHCSPI